MTLEADDRSNLSENSYTNEFVRSQDGSNSHSEEPENFVTDGPRDEKTHLQILCDRVDEEAPESWNPVRDWIRVNDQYLSRSAAEHKGEFNATALHLACRKRPPLDILKDILDIAPNTVESADTNGWLPLHHACAFGAADDILQLLLEVYPYSASVKDLHGRTPLHFAITNTVRPVTVNTIVLLSSTGAAECADVYGMLPLHHACAFGVPEDALKVLVEAHTDSITAADSIGRTPLHFAMGNCDRKSSPEVIKLLLSLSQNEGLVNIVDIKGQLPLHLLSSRSAVIDDSKINEGECVKECLDLYLNASPVASAEFLMALIALPDWLRDFVVVKKSVQDMLDEKISRRFLSFFLIMDLYSRIALIVLFYTAVFRYLNIWTQEHIQLDDDYKGVNVYFEGYAIKNGIYHGIFACALYALFREVLQIVSLLALGSVMNWFRDIYNIFDVGTFLLPSTLTMIMYVNQPGDTLMSQEEIDVFRFFSVATVLILWLSLFITLRSIFMPIAVFIGGIIHIMHMLKVFLITLLILIIAFTNIFFTMGIFRDDQPNETDWTRSFLHVYTMLLGEVNDTSFVQKGVAATLYFSLFFFLVVIILGNVLIAIVTDSYSFIRDERAAVVFWNNRMDFVAEMYAIRFLCLGHYRNNVMDQEESPGVSYLRNLWKRMCQVFDDEQDSLSPVEYLLVSMLRIVTAIMMLCLLIAGFFSFGCLWPPQIREYLFVVRTSKRVDLKEKEKLCEEVKLLKSEFKEVQESMVQDMKEDKEELNEVRTLITSMKWDMHNEMREVKKAVELLFTQLDNE